MMAGFSPQGPVWRLQRIRRLVREADEQVRLSVNVSLDFGTRMRARKRIETLQDDVLTELRLLEQTGTLAVVEECFGLVFGAPAATATD